MPKKYSRVKRKTKKVTKAVKTYVKKALDRNVEDKFYQNNFLEVGVNGSNSSNSNSVILNTISKGLNRDNRVGNQIRVKSIRVDVKFYTKSIAGSLTNFNTPYTQPTFRWALVQFKIPSEIALVNTPSDLLYDVDVANSIWSASALGTIHTNQRNIQGMKNMVILKTGKFKMQTMIAGVTTANQALPQIKLKSIVKRFKKPMTITYNDKSPGNTVSDTIKNSLWFCCMSDALAGEQYSSFHQIGWTIQYEDA